MQPLAPQAFDTGQRSPYNRVIASQVKTPPFNPSLELSRNLLSHVSMRFYNTPSYHLLSLKAQLTYAALDAWLSRQMAAALLQDSMRCPVPAVQLDSDGRLGSTGPSQGALLPHSLALEVFSNLIDEFNVRGSQGQNKVQGRNRGELSGIDSGPQQQRTQQVMKNRRVDMMPTRKSELYENCRLMVRETNTITAPGWRF